MKQMHPLSIGHWTLQEIKSRYTSDSGFLTTPISSNLFCYPSPSGTDDLSQFPTGWLGSRQTKSNILTYHKNTEK